jgi:hypothetical protein
MKGNGLINIVGDNLNAVNPYLKSERRIHKTRMCWKCQKDKQTFGGTIKMMGGQVPGALARFICKDCIEAKQAQLRGEA